MTSKTSCSLPVSVLTFSTFAYAAGEMPALPKESRILFQGDSITDGNRGRNEDPNHILGHGYVFIIAAKYGALYPQRQFAFINRGVSGNKVADLATRWQTDTINVKPDILSILIGVNDNEPIAVYEQTYDKLLADTVAALPHVQLVLCEPFAWPFNDPDGQRTVWGARIKVVERLGTKYHAPVVHFQRALDEACQRFPDKKCWIWDGVHPTYSGHQILADEWVRTVEDFYRKKVDDGPNPK